jgi:hypothetical protein
MVISNLPREPDFLIPTATERIKEGYPNLRSSFRIARMIYRFESQGRPKLGAKSLAEIAKLYKNVEDTIDDVLYWDEKKNLIYVEAIAVFRDTKEFIKFRKDLPTRFSLKGFKCPVCNSERWNPEEVSVKTVQDKKGKTWKCFSVIFVCKKCLEEGRLTRRAIKIQGLKYALIKSGRGLKNFLERIRKIEISGDLGNGSGSALIEIGEKKMELERCPLL